METIRLTLRALGFGMSVRYSFPLLVALAAQGLAAGCSGSSLMPPKTVPVSGSVTYNGKTVPGVRVKFHPQFDIGTLEFIPYGETGADGTFVLSTGASGNGAPQGEYKVTMEMPYVDIDPKDGLETEVDRLQGAYSDPDGSLLRVNVEEGKNVLAPFQIKQP